MRGALRRRWDALTGPGKPATEVTSPPTRLGYQPVLDGLRAIAVALVVLFHALPNQFRGGWVGVDIFFALSGFLITTLLILERKDSGRVSLGQFYLRRIARLMPAFFVMIILYVAITMVTKTGAARTDVLHTAWLTVTYRANLVGNPDATHGLGHMWSLALEEQFYVVWPLLLVVVTAVWRRALPWLTATGILGCIVWRGVLIHDHASLVRLYYRPDTRVDSLLIGCLAGQLFVSGFLDRRRIRSWMVWACLVGFAVLAMTTRWDHIATFVIGFPLIGVAASVMIVGSVVAPPPAVRRVLSTSPFLALGRLSYSLYLWHLPVLLFMADTLHLGRALVAGVGIPLSLAVAAASYLLVEQPFLALKDRALHRRASATRRSPVSGGQALPADALGP